ncbi:hypothetical protein SAMN05421688_0532 [Poseidonocella pacifica]|uniref:Lipoprotein n=1 Tax=Poseidonocella pacifica TaxID=871651 RepID=A0A1I0VE09_9RHOB|nr:hypothetical protein [Poseidonocella pacifica]SFA74263.1 hypothetical protein SAMN05421688_0532 [Poseidonocella pacifica]
MRKSVLLLSAAALSLGACSQIQGSRLNPVNWFGPKVQGTAPAQVPPLVRADRIVQVVETRPAIAQVTDLRIEPTRTGAIVTATGIAATQGAYDAELTGDPAGGTLTLVFRASKAEGRTAVGTSKSREVVVSRVFSNQDLAGISAVTVQAEQNTLTRRR